MTLSAVNASTVYLSPSLFTGKERDAESGLDNFGARYFGSSLGRFETADTLPWLSWQLGNSKDRDRFTAFLGNPQNLNLYAYVLNNPLNKTDPTGMYQCAGTAEQCAAIQGAEKRAVSFALTSSEMNVGEFRTAFLLLCLSRRREAERWYFVMLASQPAFACEPGCRQQPRGETSSPLFAARVIWFVLSPPMP